MAKVNPAHLRPTWRLTRLKGDWFEDDSFVEFSDVELIAVRVALTAMLDTYPRGDDKRMDAILVAVAHFNEALIEILDAELEDSKP